MLLRARRVTALANATDPFSKPFLDEQIRLGGEATGTTINPVRISSSEELHETAFFASMEERPAWMPSSFNPACRANALPSWR